MRTPCTYLSILFVLFAGLPLWASPQLLTYQGRIRDSNNQPLEYNGVIFEFTITNPTGDCPLYRETSAAKDMRNSSGVFDVPIGSGTKNFPATAGFKMLDSFDNSSVLNCEGGGTYTPAAGDFRRLRVQFFDGAGWKLISPDNEIRTVPFAGYSMSAQTAQKLGSNVAGDFLLKASVPFCGAGTYLRHIAPVGTFVCDPVNAPTNFTGALAGDVSGTQDATQVDKIKGVNLSMTGLAPGKILKYDGANWAPADDINSGGTVTGLSGDITGTGSGTIATTLSDSTVSTNKIVDSAVTANKIADGAVTAAKIPDGSVTDTKLQTITSAGKVSGSAITSGTIGGSTVINTSGFINTSSGLRVFQGSNYVEIAPPATLTGNVSLKLPNTAGSNGSLLKVDGTGQLYWDTISANDLPVTPVSKGGTGLTSTGTAHQILGVNASGNALEYKSVTAGVGVTIIPSTGGIQISATGTGGTVTNVSGTAPISVASNSTTPQISIANGSVTGQTLRWGGASWSANKLFYTDLINSLSGSPWPSTDCTAGQAVTWSSATDAFACTPLVISGANFTSQSAKTFFAAPTGTTGAPSFRTIASTDLPKTGVDGVYVNGGNSFGGDATLGTSDNYNLSLVSNGAGRILVRGDGNVGVNNTNPQAKLHVTGDTRFGCRAGFWGLSDGRICMETTLRSDTSVHTAIGTCKAVGPGSRLCTHNDFQQACGAYAQGVVTAEPYGGQPYGVYGDHASLSAAHPKVADNTYPVGQMDDAFLTWNGPVCGNNNDGLGRAALQETTTFYYRCCY